MTRDDDRLRIVRASALVRRQRALVVRLRAAGNPLTGLANSTLCRYERSLVACLHAARLRRLGWTRERR